MPYYQYVQRANAMLDSELTSECAAAVRNWVELTRHRDEDALLAAGERMAAARWVTCQRWPMSAPAKWNDAVREALTEFPDGYGIDPKRIDSLWMEPKEPEERETCKQ